jgi:hypothetical protein
MYRVLAIIFTLLAFASCEKKTDWPIQKQELSQVVVDGIITDEFKTQSIRIMYSFDTLNQTPSPVDNAEIIVSGNGNVYHFHELTGNPGTYLSDLQFSGIVGQDYSLLVTISDRVYSAKASMESGTDTFISAKYEQDPSSGLFHFYWGSDPYTPLMPAMYVLLLDWSHVAGYSTMDSATTHARLLYYSLPTLDVSQLFAPAMETVKFPAGTKIIERRYSLTKEYAAYIRALLLETTWQGGYFTTASANVPSNLSSGALGYFAACSISSRTEVVNGSVK